MFSDVPAWPPAAPSAATAAATRSGSCVPSTSSQPALQLSLDLILTENYAEPLTEHAGDGTFANGPSRDGGLRNGLARAHKRQHPPRGLNLRYCAIGEPSPTSNFMNNYS